WDAGGRKAYPSTVRRRAIPEGNQRTATRMSGGSPPVTRRTEIPSGANSPPLEEPLPPWSEAFPRSPRRSAVGGLAALPGARPERQLLRGHDEDKYLASGRPVRASAPRFARARR